MRTLKLFAAANMLLLLTPQLGVIAGKQVSK